MEETVVPSERYVWLEVFATSPTMLTGAFMPQRFEPAARAVRTEDLDGAVEEARAAAREVFVYEVCAPCVRRVCAVCAPCVRPAPICLAINPPCNQSALHLSGGSKAMPPCGMHALQQPMRVLRRVRQTCALLTL